MLVGNLDYFRLRNKQLAFVITDLLRCDLYVLSKVSVCSGGSLQFLYHVGPNTISQISDIGSFFIGVCVLGKTLYVVKYLSPLKHFFEYIVISNVMGFGFLEEETLDYLSIVQGFKNRDWQFIAWLHT